MGDQDRERVKDRLREAISLLCKSGLRFQEELSIEGLIGITMDRDDVFLVSIKEIINCGDDRSEESSTPKNNLPITKEEEQTLPVNHTNNFEVYADEPEEISAEEAWSTPVSRASPQSDGDRPSPKTSSPKESLNNHTNGNGSTNDQQVDRTEHQWPSENVSSRKRSLSPTSLNESHRNSPCRKSPAILKQPTNIFTKSHLKPAHTPNPFPHFPINRSGSFDSLWTHSMNNVNNALNLPHHSNHNAKDLHFNHYEHVAFNLAKRKPGDVHLEDLPKAEDLSRKPNKSSSSPDNTSEKFDNSGEENSISVKQERADSDDNDDSFISESEDTNMSGSNERLCADALASSHTAMMNLASMGLPTFVPMSLAQLHQANPSLSALQVRDREGVAGGNWTPFCSFVYPVVSRAIKLLLLFSIKCSDAQIGPNIRP